MSYILLPSVLKSLRELKNSQIIFDRGIRRYVCVDGKGDYFSAWYFMRAEFPYEVEHKHEIWRLYEDDYESQRVWYYGRESYSINSMRNYDWKTLALHNHGISINIPKASIEANVKLEGIDAYLIFDAYVSQDYRDERNARTGIFSLYKDCGNFHLYVDSYLAFFDPQVWQKTTEREKAQSNINKVSKDIRSEADSLGTDKIFVLYNETLRATNDNFIQKMLKGLGL